jgi:hypothetical protein
LIQSWAGEKMARKSTPKRRTHFAQTSLAVEK